MKLIINADDFGMGTDKSRGIILLAQMKKINSVSVCVNSIEPDSAILRNSKKLLNCALGLHVNLSEGKALSNERDYVLAPLKVFRRAEQSLYYEKMLSASAIEMEIRAQLKRFQDIFSKSPNHLDSHQHFAYLSPTAFLALLSVSNEYKIPIRSPRAFLKKARLEQFLERIKERYGIVLPMSTTITIKKLNSLIERYGLISRTDDCLIDFDFCTFNTKHGFYNMYNRTGSLEILCHPRLISSNAISQPCSETAAILRSSFGKLREV